MSCPEFDFEMKFGYEIARYLKKKIKVSMRGIQQSRV